MSQAETEPAGGEDSSAPETTQTSAGPRSTAVTVAAALAFVLGLYELIAGFALTGAALTMSDVPVMWWVTGPVHLVLAGLLLWGAVATVRERPNRFLVPTAAVAAIAIVVSAVMKATNGEMPFELFVLLLYAALVYLVTRTG